MSYKCYICGKEYGSPREAANCTLECSNKMEESEKQAKLKELRDKIDSGYKELKNLCKQYSDISTTESVDISLNIYDKLIYKSNNPDGLNYINCSDNPKNNYKTTSNTATNTANTTKDTPKPQNCMINDEWDSFDNMLKSSLDGFMNLWD